MDASNSSFSKEYVSPIPKTFSKSPLVSLVKPAAVPPLPWSGV